MTRRSTSDSGARQRSLGVRLLLAAAAICGGLLALGDKTRILTSGHEFSLQPWALSVLVVAVLAAGIGALSVLRSFRNGDSERRT
jgi:hypothetical protein